MENFEEKNDLNQETEIKAEEYVQENSQEPLEDANTNDDISEDISTFEAFAEEKENLSDNNMPEINYTKVNPQESYEPMNKGLKVFSGLIAVVILLTAVCCGGYFLGKNSLNGKNSARVLGLEAKPKDTDELTAAQIYEEINPSVVGIYVYNETAGGSQASGVIYSEDGYVITNDHIYAEISSPLFKIYTSSGEEYDAEYVAGDVVSDLAVLKIKSGKFTPATFGDSSQIISGENVVAIGRSVSANEDSAITKGIVSVPLHRVRTTTTSYSASVIQTDSAINPGSSGGALVNMYGQVIGITSSKLAGLQYDSVGYAIPTVTVKRIVEELINEGKVVSRAKLGITYTMMDSVAAEISKVDYVGLKISDVGEDSDLYGKVKSGDIITYVNGIEITDDDIILDVIEQSRAGDKITVTVVSENGSTSDYTVTLKANIGESSYTTEKGKLPPADSSPDNSNGGTFDFPFGE